MTRRFRIALPKGRLFDQAVDLLSRSGIRAADGSLESRRLVFPDSGMNYDFVALKPVDIPVYVESGAIDAGIVGTDILREMETDVYEPMDLRIGKCRLVVAAPDGVVLSYGHHLRVATKYPRTAERFFNARQAHVQILRLDGSVEIAPLLGLSEAIVDLVETGRTLQENGLRIVEEVAQVSARLIVNRTAMKTKAHEAGAVISKLDAVVYADS